MSDVRDKETRLKNSDDVKTPSRSADEKAFPSDIVKGIYV